MKKILEDELMSLAHSLLKMKNRSNVNELKIQAKQLYEKLSLLSFAEKHFEGSQPSIGKNDFFEAFYNEFENYKTSAEKPSNKRKMREDVNSESLEGEALIETSDASSKKIEAKKESESLLEDYDDSSSSESIYSTKTSQTSNATEEESVSNKDDISASTEENTKTSNQNEEDFGVHFDDLPLFEKAKEIGENKEKEQQTEKPEEQLSTDVFETKADEESTAEANKEEANLAYPKAEATENEVPEKDDEPVQPKTTADLFSPEKKSLNDHLKKGIKIGLNDRLAFTRQLFDGNVEDYNRVLSQLNTMHSFEEAKKFIESAVKPEYNWEDKENFESRFISIVASRFEE